MSIVARGRAAVGAPRGALVGTPEEDADIRLFDSVIQSIRAAQKPQQSAPAQRGRKRAAETQDDTGDVDELVNRFNALRAGGELSVTIAEGVNVEIPIREIAKTLKGKTADKYWVEVYKKAYERVKEDGAFQTLMREEQAREKQEKKAANARMTEDEKQRREAAAKLLRDMQQKDAVNLKAGGNGQKLPLEEIVEQANAINSKLDEAWNNAVLENGLAKQTNPTRVYVPDSVSDSISLIELEKWYDEYEKVKNNYHPDGVVRNKWPDVNTAYTAPLARVLEVSVYPDVTVSLNMKEWMRTLKSLIKEKERVKVGVKVRIGGRWIYMGAPKRKAEASGAGPSRQRARADPADVSLAELKKMCKRIIRVITEFLKNDELPEFTQQIGAAWFEEMNAMTTLMNKTDAPMDKDGYTKNLKVLYEKVVILNDKDEQSITDKVEALQTTNTLRADIEFLNEQLGIPADAEEREERDDERNILHEPVPRAAPDAQADAQADDGWWPTVVEIDTAAEAADIGVLGDTSKKPPQENPRDIAYYIVDADETVYLNKEDAYLNDWYVRDAGKASDDAAALLGSPNIKVEFPKLPGRFTKESIMEVLEYDAIIIAYNTLTDRFVIRLDEPFKLTAYVDGTSLERTIFEISMRSDICDRVEGEFKGIEQQLEDGAVEDLVEKSWKKYCLQAILCPPVYLCNENKEKRSTFTRELLRARKTYKFNIDDIQEDSDSESDSESPPSDAALLGAFNAQTEQIATSLERFVTEDLVGIVGDVRVERERAVNAVNDIVRKLSKRLVWESEVMHAMYAENSEYTMDNLVKALHLVHSRRLRDDELRKYVIHMHSHNKKAIRRNVRSWLRRNIDIIEMSNELKNLEAAMTTIAAPQSYTKQMLALKSKTTIQNFLSNVQPEYTERRLATDLAEMGELFEMFNELNEDEEKHIFEKLADDEDDEDDEDDDDKEADEDDGEDEHARKTELFDLMGALELLHKKPRGRLTKKQLRELDADIETTKNRIAELNGEVYSEDEGDEAAATLSIIAENQRAAAEQRNKVKMITAESYDDATEKAKWDGLLNGLPNPARHFILKDGTVFTPEKKAEMRAKGEKVDFDWDAMESFYEDDPTLAEREDAFAAAVDAEVAHAEYAQGLYRESKSKDTLDAARTLWLTGGLGSNPSDETLCYFKNLERAMMTLAKSGIVGVHARIEEQLAAFMSNKATSFETSRKKDFLSELKSDTTNLTRDLAIEIIRCKICVLDDAFFNTVLDILFQTRHFLEASGSKSLKQLQKIKHKIWSKGSFGLNADLCQEATLFLVQNNFIIYDTDEKEAKDGKLSLEPYKEGGEFYKEWRKKRNDLKEKLRQMLAEPKNQTKDQGLLEYYKNPETFLLKITDNADFKDAFNKTETLALLAAPGGSAHGAPLRITAAPYEQARQMRLTAMPTPAASDDAESDHEVEAEDAAEDAAEPAE